MNHRLFAKAKQLLLTVFVLASFNFLQAQSLTPVYTQTAGNSNGYYEYLPSGYATSGKNYPLMIFLEGIGELGDGSPSQLGKVLDNGPARMQSQGSWPSSFTSNGQSFSFIVITPQFTYWPGGNDVQTILNYCLSHYRVDRSRIYITGLSMGGGVTWDYASMSSQAASTVAAIVPVCGAMDATTTRAKTIAGAGLPVWGLQNQYDPTVSVQNTIDWYNDINAPYAPYANPQMRETIFPVSGHDAWDQAYDPNYRENGMNVYEWMLQYTRSGTATASSVSYAPVANAGTGQTITLPISSVTLTGTGSSANGSISSYNWTQSSGPNTASIANAWGAQTSVSNLVAGTYTFQLKVTDNTGATATSTVTITVNAAPTYVSLPGTVQAEAYEAMNNIQTEPTSDAGGGQDVGYINSGSWMDYAINVPSTGTYTISFRVASPSTGSSFQVKNSSGTALTTVTVPNTGGYQSWQTVNATVNLSQGQQLLRVYSNSSNWNLNWLQFASGTTTTTTTATSTTSTTSGSTIHIEAESYSSMNAVQTENTSDVGGGLDVGYINNGSWMNYSVNVPSAGTYTMNFRVATPASAAQFQIKNSSGTVLSTVNVPNTGGYQSWQTITASVTLSAGQQTIQFYSTSPQWNSMNLNWLEVVGGSTSTVTTLSAATTSTIHVEAESYSSMNAVQTENTSDVGGGLDVGYINNGSWMNYSVNVPSAGTYTMNFRVATPASAAQFQIKNSSGTVLATVNVPNTGGYQVWKTITASVTLSAGQQTIQFYSTSPQWNSMNLNWLEFAAATSGATASSTTSTTTDVTSTVALSVSPSTTTGNFLLLVNNSLTGTMDVKIVDGTGTTDREFWLSKDATGTTQSYLSISDLASGTYTVKVIMGSWSSTTTIVKQ